MSRTFHNTPKTVRLDQDATLDMLSSGKINDKAIRRIPLSLRPDERVCLGAAMGERYARAIVESWRPNYQVTVMPAYEFDVLSERCHTDFFGKEKDIDDSASILALRELEADFV